MWGYLSIKVECWNLFHICLRLSAPSAHSMYFIGVNVSSFRKEHPITSLTLPIVQHIRQNWHIAFPKISLELSVVAPERVTNENANTDIR